MEIPRRLRQRRGKRGDEDIRTWWSAASADEGEWLRVDLGRPSGLRVFGNGGGEKPAPAKASARRLGDLDGQVEWDPVPGAQGCNVRYGIAPGDVIEMH